MTSINNTQSEVITLPKPDQSATATAAAAGAHSSMFTVVVVTVTIIVAVIITCAISIPLSVNSGKKDSSSSKSPITPSSSASSSSTSSSSNSESSSASEDEIIYEENKEKINTRIEKGLTILKTDYTVEEVEVESTFQSFTVNGLNATVSQYKIQNFGNLVVMKMVDNGPMQMDTFVITPFHKDLPLFSTDVMYMKNVSRVQLLEVYNTIVTSESQTVVAKYLPELEKINEKMINVTNYTAPSSWLNDALFINLSKMPMGTAYDEIFLNCFYEYMNVYVKMEKELTVMGEDDYNAHWQSVRNYTDHLIESGGVSTNMFVQMWGKNKTKEYFDTVFFGTDLYKEYSSSSRVR